MQIWINFPLNSFPTTGKALEFIYPFIRMPVLSILASRSFPDGDDVGDLTGMVAELDQKGDKSFSLLSDAYDLISATKSILFRKDRPSQTEYFVLALGNDSDVQLPELLLAASAAGMTFAYKTEYTKDRWQSEEKLNAYEVENRPHAHLKKIIDPTKPLILQTRIDISENPGHARLTYTMKLMAAPEMWFGPGCWAYFDKQRVSSFPDAAEVRWLGPDLLYIRLFDWTVPDYEAGHILRLQERFRQSSGMDEVEVQLEGMLP